MVMKNMLIAGAILVSLGTGTGVYAASTNHSQSTHKALQPQSNEGPLHKRAFHHRHGRMMDGGFLKEAATTLKMDKKTLLSKLKSGQSLADIAKAQGVSVATLKSNMEKAMKTKLDEAVKAGKLTKAKEQMILSKASKNLDKVINHKGFPKRPGWGKARMMEGGFLKEAAATLKMDEKTLLSKLKSGQSLADIAKAQGVSVSTLKSNMEKEMQTKLDGAVKAGKLTKAKEQKILSNVSKGLDKVINHKGFPKHPGWGKARMMGGGLMKEAAATLKMDEKTLFSKLKSGKSLADIAKAQGVSVATLKSNMEKAMKTKLDGAVKAGKLTKAKEQKILSNVSKSLDKVINHKGFPKHPGWGKARMMGGGLMKEAAATLKMDEKTLFSKLKSGQSLTNIAKAQGVSVKTLKNNLLHTLKAKLDRAVKAGKLTSSKEQQLLSKSSKMLGELINHQGFGHKKMPAKSQASL